MKEPQTFLTIFFVTIMLALLVLGVVVKVSRYQECRAKFTRFYCLTQ